MAVRRVRVLANEPLVKPVPQMTPIRPFADDGGAVSRLYSWLGGAATPRLIEAANFSGINPEGICFLSADGRNILILSDDGRRRINGQDCKDLPEAERQFRAYRFNP